MRTLPVAPTCQSPFGQLRSNAVGRVCAQGGRSDEHRSFSRADIPSWTSSRCNGVDFGPSSRPPPTARLRWGRRHLLRATHSRCTTQRFYGNTRVATVRYCERATQPTSALRSTVAVPVGLVEQRNRSKPSCAGVKAQKHTTSKLKIGRLCTNVLRRCVHVAEAALKRITLEQSRPTSRVV